MECQNLYARKNADRMSGYMSDRMPDIMSEYVSQIEYQYICHVFFWIFNSAWTRLQSQRHVYTLYIYIYVLIYFHRCSWFGYMSRYVAGKHNHTKKGH